MKEQLFYTIEDTDVGVFVHKSENTWTSDINEALLMNNKALANLYLYFNQLKGLMHNCVVTEHQFVESSTKSST